MAKMTWDVGTLIIPSVAYATLGNTQYQLLDSNNTPTGLTDEQVEILETSGFVVTAHSPIIPFTHIGVIHDYEGSAYLLIQIVVGTSQNLPDFTDGKHWEENSR